MLFNKWQENFTQKQSIMLFAGLFFAVGSFIIIRCLFPIPDYFPDSNEYIGAALNHTTLSTRPLGYASFLRMLHSLCGEVWFVSWVQFILSELSCIWLTLLFVKIFKFKGWLSLVVLLLAGVDNLTFIYLSNTLFSDSLFTSLTILCIACLLSAVRSHNSVWGAIYFGLHLVFIWVAMKTRYSAIYYPIATFITIFWMAKPKWIKQISICLVAFLVSYYSYSAVNQFHKRTGIVAMQGFSGLQWGNNAYETFRQQPDKILHTNDARLLYIQQLNQIYFELTDTARKVTYAWLPIRALRVNYMWDSINPMKALVLEQRMVYHKDYFTSWNIASNQLGIYGKAYVKEYPFSYLKYYIIPNNLYFFTPEIENFYSYCASKCVLNKQNAAYYNIAMYNDSNHGNLIRPILSVSYIMYAVEAVFSLLAFLIIIVQKRWRKFSTIQLYYIRFAFVFFILSWAFMVISAPVMYRYVAYLTLILVPILALQLENSFFLTKRKWFK